MNNNSDKIGFGLDDYEIDFGDQSPSCESTSGFVILVGTYRMKLVTLKMEPEVAQWPPECTFK